MKIDFELFEDEINIDWELLDKEIRNRENIINCLLSGVCKSKHKKILSILNDCGKI